MTEQGAGRGDVPRPRVIAPDGHLEQIIHVGIPGGRRRPSRGASAGSPPPVARGRSPVDPAMTRRVTDRAAEVEPGSPDLGLTHRERQVLELIADGLTNRQIGEQLELAEKTVKNYVSALRAKLGMARRTQAAVYGAKLQGR
jgi:DNA-binding CsgD family transcriptional regulator